MNRPDTQTQRHSVMAKKKFDFKRLTPLRLGDEVLRIRRKSTARLRIRRKIRRFLVKLRRLRRRFVRQLTNPLLMDREDLIIQRENPQSRFVPPCVRRILTKLIRR